MDTSCPDGYSPPDLLGVGLVMVLSPLEDWKVGLLIIGIVGRGRRQLLYGCMCQGCSL